MNDFLCGECLTEMKKMRDKSIDFIFTSPPYADQIKDYGKTGTLIKPNKFDDWFLPRAQEMYRILKDNGSFVLNINDKLDGPYQSIFVFKLVVMMVEQVGFHLVRDYIWYNPATPPNVFSRGNMGRVKKSHEYCFWFSKSDTWTFNMDSIRKPYSDRMKELFASGPMGDRSSNTRPSRHNFDLSHPWKDNGGSDPGTVLSISNTSSNDMFHRLCKQFNVNHPARFPEKLVEFFILAGTNEGDVVLDPFGGSGTTAIVAHKFGRKFKYIEINPDYCDIAQKWYTVEFNYKKICIDNMTLFCNEILPKCKWDILPFDFLFDLYRSWAKSNVMFQIPITKNEFVEILVKIIKKRHDWICKSPDSLIETNDAMNEPEILILKYDLKHWQNGKFSADDPAQYCTPQVKKKYKGLKRVRI